MTIYTLDRNQKIDSDFIYWYRACREALEGQSFLIEDNVKESLVAVIKVDDDYKVKLIDKKIEQYPKENILLFKVPDNMFDNDEVHYLLLQAWLASKLTHWWKVSGRKLQ